MRLTPLHPYQLNLLVSGYLVLLLNNEFWRRLLGIMEPWHWSDGALLVSAFLVLWAFILACVQLLGWWRLQKSWLGLIVIISALAAFYQERYHILYDRTMIQNIVATDFHEATALFSIQALLALICYGLAPAALLAFWPVKKLGFQQSLKEWLLVSAALVGIIAVNAVIFYKDYSSLARNHRELKNTIMPSSIGYSLFSFARQQWLEHRYSFEKIGEDARLGPSWQTAQKPLLLVLVIGETARAANFSLGGYARNTNPLLQHSGAWYFSQVQSCGTATAISLPCIFSPAGRKNFNLAREKHRENLLDVIQRAGLDVLWRDNQSGCKGVCDRVPSISQNSTRNTASCRDGQCWDTVFLEHITQDSNTDKPGKLLVLHQIGSHGPAYTERSPLALKQFFPECQTPDLPRCSLDEIVNAYDNSLLVTDTVLAGLIEHLKTLQSTHDTGLIYVSDHGESLGENGFFLHGFPYALAPQEQTHVPMVVWLSPGLLARNQLDGSCIASQLAAPISHDHMFSSVLALLDIQTALYQPARDFLAGCRP